MLVFRPSHLVFQFKGYDVVMESHDATEDMAKFESVVKELQELIKTAFKLRYKDENS